MRISDWSSDVCSSDLGDREAYLAAGMDDYAAKPISLPQLIAAMNRALGTSDTGAATAGDAAPASPDAAAPGSLSANARTGLGNLLSSLKKLNRKSGSAAGSGPLHRRGDRKSVVSGKSVYVRGEHGG